MRRIARPFGERTYILPSREPKKKYFLAYEGQGTEPLYFEGIQSIRDELGINMLLEIIPLRRTFSEKGWSHPGKLLSCVLDYLEQIRKGEYKVSTVVDWVVEAIEDRAAATEEEVRDYLLKWFEEELGLSGDDTITSPEDVSENLADFLQKDTPVAEYPENIRSYIEGQHTTFDPEFDCVCMIVDRDRQSFKENQYDEIVKRCEEHHVQLYVTNPCFEFWLLLHFDEIFKLDGNKLLNNKKIPKSAKYGYAGAELRKLVPGYQKTDVKFDVFAPRIAKAIRNEKKYAEDVKELKTALGSNVGVLLSQLMAQPENPRE